MIFLIAIGTILLALGATTTGAQSQAAPATPEQTVKDLKAAYLGETTAHAKYTVFAHQAKKEGYASVAALFRAASDAEKYHARNHLAVLRSLGVTPEAGAYTESPGTTEANLREAIKGETYESAEMYPAMIKHATAERQEDAVRSFRYALSAERQHTALYTSALKNLNGSPAVYYVCPVCGATYADDAPAVAPLCGTPRAKFKVFK